jgi:DNA-binding XRE family transcriptional regulator
MNKIKSKMKNKNVTSWTEIKDEVYGKKGTPRRDKLDREFQSLRVGLLLRQARVKKKLTQDQLGSIIDKKRSYISRLENDASNVTLKTLYDIVEHGLGGKIKIQIDV